MRCRLIVIMLLIIPIILINIINTNNNNNNDNSNSNSNSAGSLCAPLEGWIRARPQVPVRAAAGWEARAVAIGARGDKDLGVQG